MSELNMKRDFGPGHPPAVICSHGHRIPLHGRDPFVALEAHDAVHHNPHTADVLARAGYLAGV